MKLYLASTSKFKSDILNKVFLRHQQVTSSFDETTIRTANVYDYVKDVAMGKACSVNIKDGIILGLDTIVYVDGRILGKPKDLTEAEEFIKLCSNNTTSVITGIALINGNNIINDYVETLVTLRNITDEDINFYLENEHDALYVSGFVIETIISNFIDKIEGSYYNILGIPVETIYKYLNTMNVYLKDL